MRRAESVRVGVPADDELTSARAPARVDDASAPDGAAATPITAGRRARWVALAAVPSSLMLSVTTYLSTDIAAIPLLWIVPLAIYLLTFALVFGRRRIVPHRLWVRSAPGRPAAPRARAGGGGQRTAGPRDRHAPRGLLRRRDGLPRRARPGPARSPAPDRVLPVAGGRRRRGRRVHGAGRAARLPRRLRVPPGPRAAPAPADPGSRRLVGDAAPGPRRGTAPRARQRRGHADSGTRALGRRAGGDRSGGGPRHAPLPHLLAAPRALRARARGAAGRRVGLPGRGGTGPLRRAELLRGVPGHATVERRVPHAAPRHDAPRNAGPRPGTTA